jgi:hypothetical protein
MHIITPTEIDQVAWEGSLQPLGPTFMGAPMPRVALGKPAWWPAAQAVGNETGQTWTPPADDLDYTLLRLACTLYPPQDRHTHYVDATLTVYLRPKQGTGAVVAHDLFPKRLTVDSERTFNVSLGPELEFAGVIEASLIKVGAEITYHKAFPVVQGFGMGESRPYWHFAHHAANPLLGCQSVYLVLAAPQAANGVRLSVELTANLQTRYGPVRVGLPEPARTYVGQVIG